MKYDNIQDIPPGNQITRGMNENSKQETNRISLLYPKMKIIIIKTFF